MIEMEVEVQENKENKLMQIVSTSGLEQAKAQYILEKFQGYFKIAAEYEALAKTLVVTSADQIPIMRMAREGRLFLKAKRVDIEKTRKELKEQSLREGKTIDGIANVLKGLIEPTEEYLERQEKFVEIREEERRAGLKAARIPELTVLGLVPEFYDLANMSEEAYAEVIKSAKDAIAAKEEAERKAEQERIEREAEEKRIRQENERLRKEAEETERRNREAWAKAEAERKRVAAEAEAKFKAEREAREREAAKLKKEADEKLRKEREEREKLASQLKAKAEAEAKEKKRIADEEKKAKRAPDKEKLLSLGKRIVTIELPEVKSEEAGEILQEVCLMLGKVNHFIKTKTLEL